MHMKIRLYLHLREFMCIYLFIYLFVVYVATLWPAQIIWCRILRCFVDNSLEIMWKETAFACFEVESSLNVMANGDAREGKWRGNWRMEWVASTLHTTSEHGVSSITTADAHTSAASSRLNWRPCQFKWTRPFRVKTKSGFCACAITFQKQSTVQTFARRDWRKPSETCQDDPLPPSRFKSGISRNSLKPLPLEPTWSVWRRIVWYVDSKVHVNVTLNPTPQMKLSSR